MPEIERPSNSPELIRLHNIVAEICVDVANGLDPVRGMVKVMAVIGIQQPANLKRSVPLQSTSKVVNVGRNLREIIDQIGSKEEAAGYGLESVFVESVKWLKALAEVAKNKESFQVKKDANGEEEKSSVKEEVPEKKKVVSKSKRNKNKKRK